MRREMEPKRGAIRLQSSYDPWQTGGLPFLNVAAVCSATRALGPGLRAVVWVQGCCFQCKGCIAPDWAPFRKAHLISPERLAEALLCNSEVTGLTLSGGEPMLQALGLARLVQAARRHRELDVICYTGFTLEALRSRPPGPGVEELLAVTDVLIDGPYVESFNDGRGLRGSSNQRVHFLTERLRGVDLLTSPRRVEFHLGEGWLLLVGIPPRDLDLEALFTQNDSE
jgi:anaerobic ribonucleoside-triphosphate reductase activating protein